MNEKDTYVFDEQKTKLEQIEWDDLWFQEATDTVSKRVFTDWRFYHQSLQRNDQ